MNSPLRILTLALVALMGALGVLNTPDDDLTGAAAVSFTGTWNTIAGGTHEYTLRLQQVGDKVTGSYSPGNGKIFDGVVTGRKLTFN
jgi:hypothetical protein